MLGAHEARAAWAAPRGFVSCRSGARSRWTRARTRRLSTLWSRSPLTPPTKGAASLGAAEMGQATRRELALGLRSAEASLAATRGRSRRRRGGAGARETQRRRLPSRSALGALDLLSRLGPRAVTASMLRRSLPFQPTLLAISSSNARALPTSPPARHAGRQPSPADLVGQAVRLRRLPQASPQVCQGVAYCSKDSGCAQHHIPEQASCPRDRHDQATRTTREHACTACQGACAHADARSRLRIVSFASHACVAYVRCLSRSLPHTHCSLTTQSHSSDNQSPEALDTAA